MNKKMLIGIISDQPDMYRSSEMIRGAASQAFRCNCDVVVLSSMYWLGSIDNTHIKTSQEIYNLILAENFDGFIYDRKYMYNAETRKKVEDLLVKSGKTVILPDDSEHSFFDNTAFDDTKAFETIVSHLITEHSCRKIYCLTGPKAAVNSEERLQGYKNAMENHGLSYSDSWCIYGDYWTESGKKLALDIVSGKLEKPDAVVCGNDYTASSLITTLQKNNIKVPEDIAVCGFDFDPTVKDYHHLEVTSYIRENFRIGCEAFRNLYRMITGRLCRKVSYPYTGFYPGKTCGCNVHRKPYDSREIKINIQNKNEIDRSNYFIELTSCDDMHKAASVIKKMAFRIRDFHSFSTYITEDFYRTLHSSFESGLELKAGQTMLKHFTTKSDGSYSTGTDTFSSGCLVPEFLNTKRKPSLYYLTPLHFNERVFGYAALSFGKKIRTYTNGYFSIVSNISMAIEHFRQKSLSNLLQQHFTRDKISKMQYIYEMNDIYSNPVFSGSNSKKYITLIELTSGKAALATLEYNKFSEYINEFVSPVRSATGKNEINGIIMIDVFCIVSDNPGKTEELFRYLSDYFSSEKLIQKFGIGFSFRVGSFSTDDVKIHQFDECVRQALLNYQFEYSEKNITISNKLLEQFCKIRTEIENNPEKEWHIESICSHLGISTSHFHKKYRDFFNSSLYDDIISMRIKKAENLLTDTSMTIGSISDACGYSSYCYFTKQFKKVKGVSPSEYRLQLNK